MRAKAAVPGGAPVQARGGELPWPSHVYSPGNWPPSANAVLCSANVCWTRVGWAPTTGDGEAIARATGRLGVGASAVARAAGDGADEASGAGSELLLHPPTTSASKRAAP